MTSSIFLGIDDPISDPSWKARILYLNLVVPGNETWIPAKVDQIQHREEPFEA